MMNLIRLLNITLIICLLFGLFTKVKAQSKSHIDSLMEIVKKVPEDTIKLIILDTIVDNAADGVWQQYNEQMALLSKKLMEDKNPLIRKAAKKYLAVAANNSASEFAEKGDFITALNYLRECARIQEELGNKKELGLAYSNIGAIYFRDKDAENALENYKRAIKLEESVGKEGFKDLQAALTNIGAIYYEKNNYDSALKYLERCLEIVKQQNFNNHNVTVLFKDLGYIMERKGDHDHALDYFKQGLKDSDVLGDKLGKSINLLGIAEVYFDKGESIKSLGYAQQSLTLAIKSDNPQNIQSASGLLTRIYKKQGNFKDALGMYELEIKTRDTLLRIENHSAVMRTQFQYVFDKKQDSTKAEQAKIDALKAKELENQKRIRNYILGGLLVVVFFLILVFRQRNKIAKEKQRSEELLLNILPSEVAEELKNTGEAKVKSFDLVTVLFTDFKGFTQISEKLTPEQLVSEIDYCFRGFDNIIDKYGIEKIKTIGDSYMCAGGVPKAKSTHAEDVVNAAIEIRDFVINHKKEREAKGEIPFEVRIGIHTGPVVAGIVGIKKFAYDIWGDAVNTASRMESSGEAGKVNMSGATYQLVKDKFKCQHRGKILAKGKGEVDMYFVEKL